MQNIDWFGNQLVFDFLDLPSNTTFMQMANVIFLLFASGHFLIPLWKEIPSNITKPVHTLSPDGDSPLSSLKA